jgi:hypothetical protein
LRRVRRSISRRPAPQPRGTFRSAGGELAVSAGQTLTVSNTAAFDVAGQWVNDDWRLGERAGTEPRFIDGGTVSLEAAELAIDADATINVSGGAARAADGSMHGGHGGEIELSAETFAASVLTGRLEAYALSGGGTLNVRAGSICVSTAACTDMVGSLLVTPDVFTRGGFGAYELTASFEQALPEGAKGDLRIAAGTVIEPALQNWVLRREPGLVPTGTPLTAFAELATLPRAVRAPVDLTFRHAATTGPVNLNPYTNATLPLAGALIVERGAAIEADVRAHVMLESNTRLAIDGTVRAPGGTIEATLTPSLSAIEFMPSQTIALGDLAVFDASGCR